VRRSSTPFVWGRVDVPTESRGPGVPYPPPLIFVGGFVVAWLLERQLSFEIDAAGASAVQEALGAAVAIAGLLLAAAGIVTFLRARTAIIPNRSARQLVVTGPYRFTRNPMYLGLTGVYLGLSVLLNLAWPVVVLPVVLLVLRLAVISREERHLRNSFGDQYDAYCRRVRRWL
jgi:protein-S-isoprenylcysteine O-methyltransferase Ste14